MNSWGRCEYDLRGGVGALTIVGRDPGEQEVREGVPFYENAPAGRILADALSEAGLSRGGVNVLNVSRERPPRNEFRAHSSDSLAREISHLHATLRRLRPRVIVALGNEAAHALVADWPDGRDREGLVHRGNIKSACDIENRRGYVFNSNAPGVDSPVIVSIHPAFVARTWSPWRTLLSFDLQRARELAHERLRRPLREVVIVSDLAGARSAVAELRRYRRLAADIETRDGGALACLGFAGEGGRAIVFPARYVDATRELLRDPGVDTIWANGIYDLFVLRHRYGFEFGGRVEDAQVLWHACYPELAGAKEDRTKHRFTRKSLAFLASLATYDEWWKGVYENEHEFFVYNGKDCAITFDVWEWVSREADRLEAWGTYEHERSLMWPCVDMLARGLRVNEPLRVERVKALSEAIEREGAEANARVGALLERERERLEALGKLGLFEEIEPTCTCCRHAAKKQRACWSCAGFEKAPTKADLVRRLSLDHAWDLPKGGKHTKDEIEAVLLTTCRVCEGKPRESRLRWNPNSNEQTKTILYELLRLPKRFERNAKGESVLKVDEATLKGLLGTLPSEAA